MSFGWLHKAAHATAAALRDGLDANLSPTLPATP